MMFSETPPQPPFEELSAEQSVESSNQPQAEPPAEVEDLEKIIDPNFWSERFRQRWEATKGEAKNWPGLKDISRKCNYLIQELLSHLKGVICSTPPYQNSVMMLMDK